MKCAVYVRVSTDKEEQKTSLENQRKTFIKYIADNGWDIHNFYVDIQSGTTAKRPALQELIADAKSKKFDVILAKELSRLARNGGLSYEIRDIAEKHGIHIITLDNAVNTLKGNNHMFGLYAWMYEQESQNTSNRSKQAYRIQAENGSYMGSHPPFGYEIKNKQLTIREDATPNIVRKIYSNYLKGNGFDHIAKKLYTEGIPTPAQITGKSNATDKWHGSTVRSILTNPHYVGDLVQCRTTNRSVTSKVRVDVESSKVVTIKDTHEPIITREEFESVQQLIQSRRRRRPHQSVHLFTNVAYCIHCGKGMHFRRNSHGYICGSYNKYGIKACSDHLVRESDLILAVLTDLKDISNSINNLDLDHNINQKIEKHLKQSDAKVKKIEDQIVRIKKRKKKALDDYYDEMITKEEYEEYSAMLNEDLKVLIENKALCDRPKDITAKKQSFEKLKGTLRSIIDFDKLTPEVLHRLIDKIEIKADGSPRIHYRFSNPLLFN
ncbi:MAG: recombinase family protein [Bacillota bacterium]